MPKYNFYQCPDCGEQIRGKRHLFEHMIKEHGYKNTIHAISRFYNEELNENGHFFCHECGKGIPDEKVISAVVGKGKNLVSRYCSPECRQQGSIKEALKVAHENLREEIRLHKLFPDNPDYRDRPGIAGRGMWAKAQRSSDSYNIMMGNLEKRSRFISAKLYVVKFVNYEGEGFVKLGWGNPWARVSTILKLCPDMKLIKFLQTRERIKGISSIESSLHEKFKNSHIKFPTLKGMFNDGKLTYISTVGSTEWFPMDMWDTVVSSIEFDLEDCTSEFLLFYKSHPITLIKGWET